MRARIRLAAPLLCVALPAAMQGQAPPPPPSPPACSAPAHRAFDFWVGTWDVYNPAGTLVGRNVITARNSGCTLHESYTTPSGYTGQSINAYDATRDRWHQTWSDNGGLLLLIEGGSPQEGVMRLEGTRVGPGGQQLTERITWTRLDADRVRQHWETSTDGGATWRTSFDGEYRRVVP